MEFAPPSFVEVAGRSLAYDEVRPAQPKGTIFLLTGLGSKRQAWRNQLPVFGKEYRTLALDFRDVGDSERVDQPYTVADLADDVAGVARALQIPRVHVIGISLGGFVAQNVALRHPDQVEKLILVSTSAGGATHVAAEASILALLTMQTGVGADARARSVYSRIMSPAYIGTHPEALDEVAEVALYHPFTPETYQRQLVAAIGQDVAAQVGNIIAPTLVIHGDADPLVPPQNGDYLARTIPGAKHIVYHGVGHIPILECEEAFDRAVLAFLNVEDPLVAPANETPHQKRPTKLWHWGRSEKRDSR
jgi:pimeloyl-ACP methyl ester carboxylesterase